MPLILLAALLQAGVFEDREVGTSVEVGAGWQVIFAGPEARVVLKRMDDPSAFARIDVSEEKNEEILQGNWDGYLERFKTVMAERQPAFALKRHAPAKKDGAHALDVWYSAGEGEAAVTGFFRAVAFPERLLILSAAASTATWEARHEAIETTMRSAALVKPQAGAGAVWMDRKNEFSIGVPAGYRVRPEKRGNLVLNIFAPEGGANMNVVIRGPDKSFDSGADGLRASLEAQLTAAYADFAYAEFEKVVWKGHPGIKTASTMTQGSLKIANLQFGVTTDQRSYYLTWTCLQDAFKGDRPKFEESLKTFRLIELK